MSINLDRLKVGNKVIFAKSVTKEVRSIDSAEVGLSGGVFLHRTDPLWKIAELQKPEPPHFLCLAIRDDKGNYVANRYTINYSPEAFLFLLKRDVKALEAAGVRSRSIDLCKQI